MKYCDNLIWHCEQKFVNSQRTLIYSVNFWNNLGDKDEGEGGAEEEKKRQKRGGKGIMKAKKKEDGPKLVCISRAPRGKKKSVTVVTGLSTFGISLFLFNI